MGWGGDGTPSQAEVTGSNEAGEKTCLALGMVQLPESETLTSHAPAVPAGVCKSRSSATVIYN